MNSFVPLLLHVCCAPCASGCVDRLDAESRRVTLFFSNSNIADREEFDKRLEAAEKLASIRNLPLEVDPYDHAAWLKKVSSIPDFAELPEGGARCRACFEFSLSRAAKRACALGIPFATTLTVSPHKNSALLFEVGKSLSPLFEEYNFKKRNGFLLSIRRAREYGLYRQNFCGCEFSKRESERFRAMKGSPEP